MPYIILQDECGMSYHLTSSDGIVQAMWFQEILARIGDTMAKSIMITAIAGKDGKADWPTGNGNGYTWFLSVNVFEAMKELETLRRKSPWPYEGTQ